MEQPNLSAARGSAVIELVGLGLLDSFSSANSLIKIRATYKPNLENKDIYDVLFSEFLKIYPRNKKMFNNLNL